MCRKLLLLISLCSLLGLAANVSAGQWWYGTEDTDWFNPNNWRGKVVPDSTSTNGALCMSLSGRNSPWRPGYDPCGVTTPAAIIDSGDATVDSMWSYCGESGNEDMDGYWAMRGGTLTFYGAGILLGSGGPDSDSELEVSGGTIIMTADYSPLRVGRYLDWVATASGIGTLDMNEPGGTISNVSVFHIGGASGWYEGEGHVQFDAGTITTEMLEMEPYCSMDMAGGTLYIEGNATEQVGEYLANGWITAYGGTNERARVNVDYDFLSNKTIVEGYAPDPNIAWGPSHLGIEDVTNTILRWGPGDLAEKHTIYFGTSLAEVAPGATPVSVEQDANSLAVPVALKLGQQYYWRVDEVKQSAPAATWTGDIWAFTIRGYSVIEDFEFYNDTTALRSTWNDGWDYWTSGAYVQLEKNDLVNIHGGKKSMVYDYNNTGGPDDIVPFYSEAYRDFTPTDWTASGELKALSIWYKGSADNNTLNAQMYVVLTDGSNTIVQTHSDPNAAQIASWTEWNIALEDFNNIPQSVTKMYIGFGDRVSHPSEGGKGTVYFDDIRVYVSRCLYPAPVDYDGDCEVGIKDLGAFVGDWLEYGMFP